MLIIDDLLCANNKQSGQVQIHDSAKKLVESIMNEFLLIFSSITSGKLKLGRIVAIYAKSYRSVLRVAFSLLSYSLVSDTFRQFRPLKKC